MGKVYSTEKVFEGNLPATGDHESAGRELIERLDGDGIVRGAMIYGSTVLGQSDLRSDLDILITYDGRSADEMLESLQYHFECITDHYGVSIEPHQTKYSSIANPLLHRIDPLFANHLREIQHNPAGIYNGFIYGEPLENLETFEPTERRIRNLAMQYANRKAGKFETAITKFGKTDGVVDLDLFQRALEVPAAIGRKMIPATDMLGEEDYDTTSKQETLQLTRRRLVGLRAIVDAQIDEDDWSGSVDSGRTFDDLVELNDTYNALLIAAVSGGVDREDYDDWLRDNYLDAIRLARKVADDWTELIRRTGVDSYTLEPYVRGDDDELEPLGPDDDDEFVPGGTY